MSIPTNNRIRCSALRYKAGAVLMCVAFAVIYILHMEMKKMELIGSGSGTHFHIDPKQTQDQHQNQHQNQKDDEVKMDMEMGLANVDTMEMQSMRDEALERMEDFQPRRGVRYLYEQYGLLLAVRIPTVTNAGADADAVEIVDISPLNDNDDENGNEHFQPRSSLDCTAFNLTIWVRITGPEIIAGIAQPQHQYNSNGNGRSRCSWIFQHRPLTIDGKYERTVKVLVLNDGLDVKIDQCHFQDNTVLQLKNSNPSDSDADSDSDSSNDTHFKISTYAPPGTFWAGKLSCCDICTRDIQCRYFAYQETAELKEFVRQRGKFFVNNAKGCVFYSLSSEYDNHDIHVHDLDLVEATTLVKPDDPKDATKVKHGDVLESIAGRSRRRNIWGKDNGTDSDNELELEPEPTYFLGCGYSAGLEDAFCLKNGTDDIPYIQPQDEFFIVDNNGNNKNNSSDSKEDDTTANAIDTDETETSMPMPICPNTLEGVGHGRWVKTKDTILQQCQMEPHYNLFPQYVHKNDQPEECWIRDKLIGNLCTTGCARNPIHNLWKSSLTETWFEYTWKPYDCHLPLYTEDMLKSCIVKHGYAKPVLYGDSVRDFFTEYMNARFDQLDDEIYGNKTVAVENFRLFRRLWGTSFASWEETVQGWVQAFENGGAIRGAKSFGFDVKLWFNGPFLSSERESHDTPGRMKMFTDLARPYLVEKGNYLEVDWTNVSMALSHEGATQYDGLHVIGSSMKMAFHMVVHRLCGE